MARITCRQPSTGKPINIRYESVPDTFVTIAEAPDFSVPDPSESQYPGTAYRDPTNSSRGIAAGEIFFLTPLIVKNKTGGSCIIEVRFIAEGNTASVVNDALGATLIPAGESVAIPLQGRSLIKRTPATANGDLIQVKSSVSGACDVWASANEQASAEHVGVGIV